MAERRSAGTGWNVWRTIVGLAYLAAAVFNTVYTFSRGDELDGYADGAWFGFLGDFIRDVFMTNHEIFMSLVIGFEVVVAALILARGALVDVGISASVIWVLIVLPFLAWPYLITNLVLAPIQGAVLLRRYDQTPWHRPTSMGQSTERTNIDANIELVVQAGALIRSGFVDRDNHPFADDFVFHYFNPQLPDLAGDHHGFEGIADLFERFAEVSETGFRNVPHSLTPCGDELLVAFATNTLGFGGTTIDVDAVVVWRVFGGQIQEAWDIPAINTVRPHRPSPTQTGNSRSNPTD